MLATLADHPQGAVAAVDVQAVDVGAERCADPQAVQGQQRDECMIASRSDTDLDQQGADLGATHAQHARLGVDLGSADVTAGFRARSPSRWQER